ncbi:MAG: arsenite/tail-anchored protein-transporting ATPase [Actinomycetota bacterium]|nr:arsenite/tail-anchored protein-transporting ATPase [Actinomycetota bacterium]
MLRRRWVLLTMAEPSFLTNPPRFLFFTGKGGVGKTSLACASALALSGAGARVLLVSTDPASNVSQVLGLPIGNTITAIPDVPGLSALEIDPVQAADAYRESIIGPVRDLLPAAEIASITEQLSGSCTTEVASFNEFTDLLTDPDLITAYDHVIFDTAPTGHTLRLLQLPGSWTEYLNAGKGDASCLGPLAGLAKQRSIYAAAVAALQDRTLTRLVLVARANTSALSEAARTARELSAIGITNATLVVNGVLPPEAGDDPLAHAILLREAAALANPPTPLATIPRDIVALQPFNMVGLPALRSMLADVTVGDLPGERTAEFDLPDAPLASLVDGIEADGPGLVMCLGKGGVGKTTIAAALAVALADRGHDVLLTTTDPAAHLHDTLAGAVDGIEVSRIDPAAATAAYRERVLATKGRHLDDAGRAVLTEDLRSPCTEEVAVFGQFSAVVHQSRRRFVILDTAPTGHTLLLLDAAGASHREITRQMGPDGNYTTPLMRLRDPAQTKVIIVTLAEPTPVAEAEELATDLARAQIHPWAWVVNSSLAAAVPRSELLRQRAAAEVAQLQHVRRRVPRIAVVPLLAQEPKGPERLRGLTSDHLTAAGLP